MSSHFSLKSLAFYGIAIGSVLTLFSLTTAYGESNLKAPHKIDGRYPINTQLGLSCLAKKPVVLMLQQSGIYLTGSLLLTDAPKQTVEMAAERPSLTGKWDGLQIKMDGSLAYIPGCQEQVTLQGRIAQEALNGTLRFSSTPTTVEVVAPRQAQQETSQAGH